jgi:hypothetical protein
LRRRELAGRRVRLEPESQAHNALIAYRDYLLHLPLTLSRIGVYCIRQSRESSPGPPCAQRQDADIPGLVGVPRRGAFVFRAEKREKAALMTRPHHSSAFRMQRPPCGRLPELPYPARVRHRTENLQVFSTAVFMPPLFTCAAPFPERLKACCTFKKRVRCKKRPQACAPSPVERLSRQPLCGKQPAHARENKYNKTGRVDIG